MSICGIRLAIDAVKVATGPRLVFLFLAALRYPRSAAKKRKTPFFCVCQRFSHTFGNHQGISDWWFGWKSTILLAVLYRFIFLFFVATRYLLHYSQVNVLTDIYFAVFDPSMLISSLIHSLSDTSIPSILQRINAEQPKTVEVFAKILLLRFLFFWTVHKYNSWKMI